MKYDNEYLKTLYNNKELNEFLSVVSTEEISDPRLRAIIGALKRSITVLHLEFNPIEISHNKKEEEVNQPQQ